jgi:CDP-diacylglycerol--glycerol-3-phosphate 3-phosphatidyltransferase
MLAAPAVVIVFLCLDRPYADWVALFLFIGASITDYIDGYLARKWSQQSAFGTMLDPIADKAMVILAIVAIIGLYGLKPLIVIPMILILFREVFVSGLREFLGKDAGRLAVTKVAKWKTTVQMVAISVLFLHGIFEHNLRAITREMDKNLIAKIISNQLSDETNLMVYYSTAYYSYYIGITLLWIAMLLTIYTGIDYLTKASPYLKGKAK